MRREVANDLPLPSQDVYVVCVNDVFVVEAWKEKLGGAAEPNVHFLADDAARFVTALGLSFDASPLLGNHRSKRKCALPDGVRLVSLSLSTGTDTGRSRLVCDSRICHARRGWRRKGPRNRG